MLPRDRLSTAPRTDKRRLLSLVSHPCTTRRGSGFWEGISRATRPQDRLSATPASSKDGSIVRLHMWGREPLNIDASLLPGCYCVIFFLFCADPTGSAGAKAASFPPKSLGGWDSCPLSGQGTIILFAMLCYSTLNCSSLL